MRLIYLLFAFSLFIFSSCEVKVKGKKEAETETGTKTKNGIVVKSKGLNVEQAFLLFEDNSFVPDNNSVKINQKVILRLVVSGWKEKDGKVFISGGESVESSKGQIILDEKDLLKAFKEGVPSDDARYLSLKVWITEITELYDYYKVSFYIKDDNNPDSFAEGYYKLYLK